MDEAVVVFITARKIQSYVFSSNRLREHIGASHLIKQATTNWVDDALKTLNNKRIFTIKQLEDLEKRTSDQLNENSLLEEPLENFDALVISTGAGQVRLLIDACLYQDFVKNYTRRILKEAPGLPIYVGVSQSFMFNPQANDNALLKHIKQAEKDIRQAERTAQHSNPLLGLGVTVKCASTGLPAVGIAQTADSFPAAQATLAKNNAVLTPDKRRPADDAIFAYLDIPPKINYRMPLDFDDFGRSEGDQSYVAVVHIDGNNMGERVGEYLTQAKSNQDFITRSRYFSFSVERAVRKALQVVLEKAHPQGHDSGTWTSADKRSFNLKQINNDGKNTDRWYLPLRFLIIGGDDITFVCDGRLGLGLAALCLQELEKSLLADGKKLYGCAGVSIVKTHYPFARAYDLAEELSAAAKALVRSHNTNASALDWHLALSGLSGDLDTIREREYEVTTGKLYLRPVVLNPNKQAPVYQQWTTIRELTLTFAGHRETAATKLEDQWSERRNKVMHLREALRGGSDAVRQFTAYYGRLPSLDTNDLEHIQTSGWQDKTCIYFDPIEIIDFYLPLYKD